MLKDKVIEKIRKDVKTLWRDDLENLKQLKVLSQGKEKGHRIADFVDDITSNFIVENFDGYIAEEKRSMGDVWIDGNPINIKTGVISNGLENKEGQPNIVSMAKLTKAIMEDEIDSYYLLIIKFEIPSLNPHIFFVDILDYLEYVNFNMGPGQLMLKEKDFYLNFDEDLIIKKPIKEKLSKLKELYEEGYLNLMKNREMKMKNFISDYEDFMQS